MSTVSSLKPTRRKKPWRLEIASWHAWGWSMPACCRSWLQPSEAKMYSVKEIFYTLQGEGAQAGRAAVFCRFAGCNLWSGREQDRARALCDFCDTDFVGVDGPNGGKFSSARELARQIRSFWPDTSAGRQ